MNQTADPSTISSFLKQAKYLMSCGRYRFVSRSKNLQALSQHGLTVADVKEEIQSLVIDDYYKGPKPDFDQSRSGDIWEFKKEIDGEPFYVKLKIQNLNGKNILKCLSFHEDEFVQRKEVGNNGIL